MGPCWLVPCSAIPSDHVVDTATMHQSMCVINRFTLPLALSLSPTCMLGMRMAALLITHVHHVCSLHA